MPFYGFIVTFENLGLIVSFCPSRKRVEPIIGSDDARRSSMMPSWIPEAIQAIRIEPALHNYENFDFSKFLPISSSFKKKGMSFEIVNLPSNCSPVSVYWDRNTKLMIMSQKKSCGLKYAKKSSKLSGF